MDLGAEDLGLDQRLGGGCGYAFGAGLSAVPVGVLAMRCRSAPMSVFGCGYAFDAGLSTAPVGVQPIRLPARVRRVAFAQLQGWPASLPRRSRMVSPSWLHRQSTPICRSGSASAFAAVFRCGCEWCHPLEHALTGFLSLSLFTCERVSLFPLGQTR